MRDVMRELPRHRNGTLVVEATSGLPADTVHADDTLRDVANRFAVTGLTRASVTERADPGRRVGEIRLTDLLQARLRDHHEEHHRERILLGRIRVARSGLERDEHEDGRFERALK